LSTILQEPPTPSDDSGHWNQWEDAGRTGLGQDNVKFSLGIGGGRIGPHGTGLLSGELEYMLRDRIGMVGMTGVNLFGADVKHTVVPFLGGVQLHLFPKHSVDVTVGARAGMALIFPGAGAPEPKGPVFVPRTDGVAGVHLHYFGALHLGFEGSYCIFRRDDGPAHVPMQGPAGALKLGFFL
jgi:hypothetical protein